MSDKYFDPDHYDDLVLIYTEHLRLLKNLQPRTLLGKVLGEIANCSRLFYLPNELTFLPSDGASGSKSVFVLQNDDGGITYCNVEELGKPSKPTSILFKAGFFGFFLFIYFIQHCFICRAPQIPLCRRMLGTNAGRLRLLHW
jgi:hypothetical protein